MRVKISYGAHIDEVPEEIDQLYTYISAKIRKLEAQTEQIEDALAEEDLDTAIPLMDKMRRTLGSLDQRLADIEMIASGYTNYKKGDEDVSDGRPSLDTTGVNNIISQPE